MKTRFVWTLAALLTVSLLYVSLRAAEGGKDSAASYTDEGRAEGGGPLTASYGDTRQVGDVGTFDTAAAPPDLKSVYVGFNGGYFLGLNGKGNVISRGRNDLAGVHLANTLSFAGASQSYRAYEIVGWKKDGKKTWHLFPKNVPAGQRGEIYFGVGNDLPSVVWFKWDDATMGENKGNMK